MNPVYIFDLDGTLANIEHRMHFIADGRKQWAQFFAACVDDTPILRNIETMNLLRKAGAEIWIWSGRSDEVKPSTVEWLCRNNCFGTSRGTLPAWPFMDDNRLRMRKAGDYRPDTTVKEEWLLALDDAQRSRIAGVFEDRKRVVDMWRSNGLTTYQVSEGEF